MTSTRQWIEPFLFSSSNSFSHLLILPVSDGSEPNSRIGTFNQTPNESFKLKCYRSTQRAEWIVYTVSHLTLICCFLLTWSETGMFKCWQWMVTRWESCRNILMQVKYFSEDISCPFYPPQQCVWNWAWTNLPLSLFQRPLLNWALW